MSATVNAAMKFVLSVRLLFRIVFICFSSFYTIKSDFLKCSATDPGSELFVSMGNQISKSPNLLRNGDLLEGFLETGICHVEALRFHILFLPTGDDAGLVMENIFSAPH